MTWAAIVALAIGTYALKAAGPIALGGRELPPWLQRLSVLLPSALLAGLVAVQTFGGEGRTLVLDARAAGLAAAGIAIWRRAPFVVVVGVAMLTAALVRAW